MAIETLLLKTPLNANTGYGHDGFHLSQALEGDGIDTRLLPMSVVPPVPMETARLLVKGLDVDFDYLLHHTDPKQMRLTDGEVKSARRKIAWTMWEFTSFGEDESADRLGERLADYDLILAYDPVTKQALEPHAAESGTPIQIIQGGYRSDDWGDFDLRDREWHEVFRFAMVGALHQRKNPFAAIRAYQRLHDEGHIKPGEAELHLKTTVLGLHPAMEEHTPGLKIHYDLWPHDVMRAFYANIHCLLAPSWGEGKNLPALEAMTMGVPVIYSNFGGHTVWGSSEYGWPVNGPLEEHDGSGCPSMRVDEDELMAAMLDAFTNRSETRRKGEIAARVIPSMCDWEAVVPRMRSLIRAL